MFWLTSSFPADITSWMTRLLSLAKALLDRALAVPERRRRRAFEVGLDVVEVEAVEAALRSRSSVRYLELVYSRQERADSTDDAGRIEASRLAARFAAKEAVMKALGAQDLPWRSIEVLRAADGRPSVRLTGRAAAWAAHEGLRRFSISLTHEPTFAAAVAVVTA